MRDAGNILFGFLKADLNQVFEVLVAIIQHEKTDQGVRCFGKLTLESRYHCRVDSVRLYEERANEFGLLFV